VDVTDPRLGIVLHQAVADGLDQVGLAQADTAIDEQGVVAVTGIVGHLQGGGARQVIGLAGHEGIEGEQGVEARFVDGRRFFGFRGGGSGGLARGLFPGLLGGDRLGRRRRVDGAASLGGFLAQAALVGNNQGNRWRLGKETAGEQIDLRKKFVAHPLGHEPVGRAHDDAAGRGFHRQGLDPGVELLGVQRTLEMGEAMAPEVVHDEAGCEAFGREAGILAPRIREPEKFDKSGG
jgi:hypothetical protein